MRRRKDDWCEGQSPGREECGAVDAAGLERCEEPTLCGQKPWAWMILSSGVLAASPCEKDNMTYFLGFCENKRVLFVEQLEQ